MDSVELLQKGLYYCRQGEFGTIIGHLKTKKNTYQSSPEFSSQYSSPSPTWLSVDNINYISSSDTSEFFYASVDENEFRIETEDSFSRLDLEILGTQNCGEIEVSCESNSNEEGSVSETISIKPGVRTEPKIPVSISFDKPVTDISVSVNLSENKLIKKWNQLLGKDKGPKITKPTFPLTDETPIFLISIDSLRHDSQPHLSTLLDELGDSAFIPQEPRTQGTCTPPSHASMFTGTHPGIHTNVGNTDSEISKIDKSLTTIGDIVSDSGYKSSALTTSRYLRPELGFGNGFDRFYCTVDEKHFLSQKDGLRESASDITSWIDEDMHSGYMNSFYFWHIFPPHWPYIPPAADRTSSIDLSNQFREKNDDYITNLGKDPRKKDAEYDQVQSMYDSCVEYVSDQVARVVNHLKYADIFEDALIMIVGDHGEEFGERGFYGHSSLYDSNIKPFMTVKPPRDASWTMRNEIDFVDILPTIAKQVGASVPEQCVGVPIQEEEVQRPRITERIQTDYYNVSVEIDGWKGIFTYEENYPGRPPEEMLGKPVHEEYYPMQSVRASDFNNKKDEINQELKQQLRQAAEEFIVSGPDSVESELETMSTQTKNQLKDLGYIE